MEDCPKCGKQLDSGELVAGSKFRWKSDHTSRKFGTRVVRWSGSHTMPATRCESCSLLMVELDP